MAAGTLQELKDRFIHSMSLLWGRLARGEITEQEWENQSEEIVKEFFVNEVTDLWESLYRGEIPMDEKEFERLLLSVMKEMTEEGSRAKFKEFH